MGTAEPQVAVEHRTVDRRLSARHRCAQAERHRHDLRPAWHPDHRPHARAGRRHARALVPPRAECRVRGFDRGFLTQKPGICLTVSAPGFLNGLNALAHATVNCFPMILISRSSSARSWTCSRAITRRWISTIARPVAKAAYRVLHADDIGVGVARAIRAALSGRPGGVYLDLPAKLFAQAIDAATAKKTLIKVVDPAPKQIPRRRREARA